jgi:hypothetical protein
MSRALRVRGNSTLAKLKANLKALPITVAHEVAASAAPGLTTRVRGAFDAGQTVYGEARPPSVNGGPLTLEQSGATKRTLQFVSNGRIVRCVLGTPYAKYLVGKYKVLPNGAMPAEWSRYLAELLERAKVERYLRVGP